MSKPILSLTPLGGLGSIGANMQLIESACSTVLIDCGILFPKDDHFGLRFLIPDFYSALQNKNVSALVITHGHEDHIGAVAFLARHFPGLTVYAPPFAAALIRKKTEERNLALKVITFDQDTILDFDDFTITPISVEHSIPQTYGMMVRDKQDTVGIGLFTDFKLDRNHQLCSKLLEQFSKSKKKVLLCDSTNILSSNEPISEEALKPHLEEVFSSTQGRIFLTCFASNIYRLQTIFDLAAEQNRYVVAHGRSMLFYISVALEMGLLIDSHNRLRTPEQLNPSTSNQIILLSGCQGEYRGTLRRVAFQEDSTYRPTSDDLFVFSSKTIPGNEFSIGQILNVLSENKIPLVTASDAPIHASGHLSWTGLSKLYQAVSPDIVVPVHGESFFLLRHHEKIKKNFASIEPLMLTNADQLQFFASSEHHVVRANAHEPLFIHGDDIVIERSALSERRKMSSEGMVSLAISLESVHRRHPKFSVEFFGLPLAAKEQLQEFESFMHGFLKTLKIVDREKAKEEIRVATRRFFLPYLGYRPLAIIHLL